MEGTWRQIDALATALLAYTLAADLGGFMAAFAAGIVVIPLAEQRPALLSAASGTDEPWGLPSQPDPSF